VKRPRLATSDYLVGAETFDLLSRPLTSLLFYCVMLFSLIKLATVYKELVFVYRSQLLPLNKSIGWIVLLSDVPSPVTQS